MLFKNRWIYKWKERVMLKRSLNCLLENAKNAKEVVIVGAGERGKELLGHLRDIDTITIHCFFDNSDKLTGSKIKGIEILKPCNLGKENYLYVIAVDKMVLRKELHFQLVKLGIQEECITAYYFYRDNDYLRNLNEKYYQEELQEIYFGIFGKRINWENPTTYNEKINWEKLSVKDDRRTRLADKYLVREWIKEQIGEKYLTKLYGVWDHTEEIDFDKLPQAFAIKLNNGSGRNIIVKDKSMADWGAICQKLNEWKERNFAFETLELHYRDIVPKIICEEYLEGVAENVYDYNVYCFHGEPVYIWCIKGSHRPGCKASFYNKDWEMQPFSFGYPKDPVLAPKPERLEEMLFLSKRLCKEFEHVRVDWYNLPDGRVLFGEMSFSSWSGLRKWEPEEYDTVFGKLI